jgi:hypothetical protein
MSMIWRRHQHQMAVVDTYYPLAGSPLFGGVQRTVVLRRCGGCAELDTVTLDGKWDLLQLRSWGLLGATEDDGEPVPAAAGPDR